jgi:hypothetical protein
VQLKATISSISRENCCPRGVIEFAEKEWSKRPDALKMTVLLLEISVAIVGTKEEPNKSRQNRGTRINRLNFTDYTSFQ